MGNSTSGQSYGGGALKITATSLNLAGTLAANGTTGSNSYAPGAAGGSIWLDVSDLTIADSGRIQANGSNGKNSRGGGGGGRVAIHFDQFSGNSTAAIVTGGSSSSTYGSAGTLYRFDRSLGQGRLVIDNSSSSPAPWSELDELLGDTSKLTVEMHGRVRLPSGTYTLDKLDLFPSAYLSTHRYNADTQNGGVLQLDTRELSISEGATIAVTGLGYGRSANQNYHIAGSHGGRGGAYSDNESGAVYGDYSAPVTLGEGAVGSGTSGQSYGGGALKITATSLNLAGTLAANGATGSNSYAPGAAGGSIWLDVSDLTITDSGRLQANGSHGKRARGGGGGGRVALYYRVTAPFSESEAVTVSGGSSSDFYGEAGTIVINRVPGTVQVTGTSLEPMIGAPVNHIDIRFSNELDPTTFTVADITLWRGEEPIFASAVIQLGVLDYRVQLPEPLDGGSYSITIGPNIHTYDGNGMDQDLDGTTGMLIRDSYSRTFTINTQKPDQPTLTSPSLDEPTELTQTKISLEGERNLEEVSIWLNGGLRVASGLGGWQTEANLQQGTNTLELTAVNRAGNKSEPLVVEVYVDSIAPTIGAVLEGHTNQPPQSLVIPHNAEPRGLDETATQIDFTVGGVAVPVAVAFEAERVVLTPSQALEDGSYQVVATLADALGNTSATKTFDFTVDTVAPDAPELSDFPSVTSVAQLKFTGSKESGSAIRAGGQTVVSKNTSTSWQWTATLEPGENVFTFSSEDLAGNVGTERTVTVVFDDKAPLPLAFTVDAEGSGTEAVLDWSGYDEIAAGADITHYEVYQQAAPFTSIDGLAPVVNVNQGKSWELVGLTRNQPVYIAVIAVDKAGLKSDLSASVEVVPTDIEPPEKLSNLVVVPGSTTLTLSWNTSPDLAGDLVGYRVTVQSGDTPQTQDLEAAAVSVSLTGLAPATANLVRVTAFDGDGNESEAVQNPGVTLLPNPSGVSAEPLSGKVAVSWLPVPQTALVKTYRIYIEPQAYGAVIGLGPKREVSAATTNTQVAGLENGVTYHLAVTAVNLSSGEEQAVTTVAVTPEADNEGPEITSISFVTAAGAQPLVEGAELIHSGQISIAATDESGLGRAIFKVDGTSLGTDFDASPAFTQAWDLKESTDGAHTVEIVLEDTLGNATSHQVPVTVALAPPSPPVWSSPTSGLKTNEERLTVKGTAEPGTQVQLYFNGTAEPDVLETATGVFSREIALQEGENTVTAKAAFVSRGLFGDSGSALLLTRDSTIPERPTGLSASSKPLGAIALSWQPPADENVLGYNLYRAETEFDNAQYAGVGKVNNALLKTTSFQDMPDVDGDYVYRVVSVNEIGTESSLSNSTNATADSELPRALSIVYDPVEVYDSVLGRMGPGQVNITATFNEELRVDPYLAFTVSGGRPMVARVTRDRDDAKVYTGSFTIEPSSGTGVAYAVLSAHDKVGNRGTTVVEGSQLLIDTKGPEVTDLTLMPSSPIKNDPDESGLGRRVTVTLKLAEPITGGQPPVLVPTVTHTAGTHALAGYEQGVALAISSDSDEPVYQGEFDLPVSVGQDANGEPNVEMLGFLFTAEDDLGNVGELKGHEYRFQVYQGDLPPVATPTGFTGKALPSGQAELQWKPVEGAAGYRLYRRAPAETELTELVELDYPAELRHLDGTNAPLIDGAYQYAIASVRQQNGQTAVSAMSAPVTVNTDATAPDAPAQLALELTGSGIEARWQPPASEVQDGLLTYNLYRLDLPIDTVPDLSGETPLQTGIPAIWGRDSRPSATEHLYVVTAVDPAGNESAPSNPEYLNVALLPVSDLHIALADQGRPVLSWSHTKAAAVSFVVYRSEAGSEPVKLTESPIAERTFEDLGYHGGLPVSGAPADALYTVVAVDANDVNSIGHELLLPALSASLVDGEGAAIERGILNRVLYRVANAGNETIVQARLKVTLVEDATPRVHWSERFTVAPGAFTDVPVIIGGYEKLPTLAAMDMQIVLEPQPGQTVEIQQNEEILVGQSALVAGLETVDFIRGGAGKVRIRLENPSDVETEILMATGKGTKDSTEVRLVLKDLDGNILSSQATRQLTGDVISLANGETVARIPANGTYLSQAFDVAVPSTAPDQVRVHLELDRFRYHSGRDTFVAIGGTRAQQDVSLEETAYYGELAQVSPETVFVGATVELQGSAIDRASQEPLANVPLTLVLSARGFERSFPVYTDNAGQFSYNFRPGASESGEYQVSVLHPRMLERPEHGRFTVEGAGVSPTRARLTIPRNYEYTLNIKVQAGYATQLNNVRLAYAPTTDGEGNALPAPDGMQFDLGAPQQIAANQSAYLKLRFSGDSTAVDSGTLRFHVVADNRTQPLDTVAVEFFLTEAKPILLPQPSLINTGVGLGQSQQESITLKNTGLEQALNLSVSLITGTGTGAPAPDWVKLMTPASIAALAVGEQTEVQVALAPDEDVPANDYFFKVRVQGDNLSPIEIPVLVAATQSATGSVFFHTTDIYTATLDENQQPIPGLGGVKVKLQNTKVLSKVFDLTTDASGYGERADIPAGRYSYRASAFDHEAVSGHLWVKPGVTTKEDVFLMNKLINVEFSVTEITLEDRYDIVLSATYETNVPVPVVLFEPMSVNLPMLKKGEVFQGEFTISNYGLIEAYDVKTTLPTGDDYARFDYLVEIPDVLAAGQVVRVPYRIVALQDFDPSGEGEASGGGCVQRSYKAVCTYSAECAVGTIIDNVATMIWNAISGSSCGASGGSGGGGGYFGGGYFGGGGGINYSPAPAKSITVDDQFCPSDCETCCGKSSGGAGGFGGGGFGGAPGGPVTGVPQLGGGL